jgi:hypothetical protein
MKVMLDVTDNRAMFILELLRSFPYVTVRPVIDEDNQLENNSNLEQQNQTKQLPKTEITISPFVMSMVTENPIPADYDYKADYKNYLSEKYALK